MATQAALDWLKKRPSRSQRGMERLDCALRLSTLSSPGSALAAMNRTQTLRTCPICGQQMAVAFCQADGGQTVIAEGLLRMPWDYGVGDVVGGRYRIVEQIARGGFATVFRAEHVGTGQTLALKLLAFVPSNRGWLLALRRFFREARVNFQC